MAHVEGIIIKRQIHWQDVWPWLLILTLPLFVFSASTSILLQQGWVDPFYYTGYVHNYHDLVERFGRTYYSTRVSFIYPERFLVWLFGSKLGYGIFRYILLTALLASIFKIARRYSSMSISLLAVFLMAFNPWLLRSLYYDFYDGATIVYLTISLHFLIAHYQSKTIPYILSGVFFAMAVNCNLFLIAIGGLFFPSFLILSWTQTQSNQQSPASTISFSSYPYKIMAKKTGLILFGFLWCLLFLSLMVYSEFPQFNLFLESAAINMMNIAKQGKLDEYWLSFKEIFYNSGHGLTLFFPICILLIGMIFYCRSLLNQTGKRSEILYFGLATLLYLSLTNLLFFIMHLNKMSPLSLFHYISFMIPATSLVIIWLLGESTSPLSPKQRTILCIGTGLLYCIFAWLAQSSITQALGTEMLAKICLAVAIVSAIAMLIVWKSPILRASLLCMVLAFSPIFFSHPLYHVFSFHQDRQIPKQISQSEWDVYNGSIELQKWISALPPAYGLVKFWYDDQIWGGKFKSIHSTMLWGHNLLTKMLPGSMKTSYTMSMPSLENISLDDILNTDYIAILSETPIKINQGKEALDQMLKQKHNIRLTPVIQKEYHSKTFHYYLSVLKKENASGHLISSLLLQLQNLGKNSLFIRLHDSILLKTNTKPGLYNAMVPLWQILPSHLGSKETDILLQLKVKVKEGKLGIGILNKQGEQWISQRVISPSEDPIILDLNSSITNAGYFVLFNATPKGTSTEANFYEINLYHSGSWSGNN